MAFTAVINNVTPSIAKVYVVDSKGGLSTGSGFAYGKPDILVTCSIFSRDGEYLGWIEGKFAWDKEGKFRGQVWQDKYIIVNRFAVQPLPKVPRIPPLTPALPNPPPNIIPVTPPTGWADGF